MTPTLTNLRIKLYADGAGVVEIAKQAEKPHIAGFTTNPTLMRKAGVTHYKNFARAVLAATDKPVSFEVLSDDFEEMRREALVLHALGPQVFVKIPVTNCAGVSSAPLVTELRREGVKVNVTAILTDHQVTEALAAVAAVPKLPAILSIFAGRIADTGRHPEHTVLRAALMAGGVAGTQILWASTREVLNIVQADQCGAHIITVPPDILAKAERLLGYDLAALSLETVAMLAGDARAAGYSLESGHR